MKVLVDENVSIAVAARLRAAGHDVVSIAETADRGVDDASVYELAVAQGAVLVTRDHHLTNELRFPASRCAAVLYIRHGNLQSEEEASLVCEFVATQPLDDYLGQFVTLYRDGFRIRPARSR